MKKKIFYIICSILLILIITNPGYNSINSFLGEQEFTKVDRKANYIICSVYSVDFISAHNSVLQENYFAILGKFYKLEQTNKTREK